MKYVSTIDFTSNCKCYQKSVSCLSRAGGWQRHGSAGGAGVTTARTNRWPENIKIFSLNSKIAPEATSNNF